MAHTKIVHLAATSGSALVIPINNISLFDSFLAPAKKTLSDYVIIRRSMDNWWTGVLFYHGIYPGSACFRVGGERFEIRSKEDYKRFFDRRQALLRDNFQMEIRNRTVKFRYNGKAVKFAYDHDDALMPTLGLIRSVFWNKSWRNVRTKGKVVVDIGAAIGDTSIYFTLSGAKRVYALEPMPRLYKLLAGNIKANGMKNIIPLNKICSNKGVSFKMPKEDLWGGEVQEASGRGKSTTIGSISLDELVDRYRIRSGASLKLNCEGGEYDIILNGNDDTLKRFSFMEIDYHYGYKNLVKRLKELGYSVKFTRPAKNIDKDFKRPLMYMGRITAILK